MAIRATSNQGKPSVILELNADLTQRSLLSTTKIQLLVDNEHLIPEIAQLKFQEFSSLAPKKTLDDFVQGLKTHLNGKELPITYVLVNETKEFVGTFSLRKYDMETHQHLTPWVGSVLVSPKYRNQGIGAFLVEQVELKAKEMGYPQLYLFTPKSEAWYQKLGWRTIEHTLFNQTSVAVMCKKINDQ